MNKASGQWPLKKPPARFQGLFGFFFLYFFFFLFNIPSKGQTLVGVQLPVF